MDERRGGPLHGERRLEEATKKATERGSQWSVPIACSTIGWGKITDAATYGRVLHYISSAGYPAAAVELSYLPDGSHVDAAAAVKRQLERSGLSLAGVSLSSPAQVVTARDLGATSAWLCLFEEDRQAAIDKTADIADLCARAGIRLAIHPHVDSSVSTIAQLDEILESRGAKDDLSVCADTAHLAALGLDVSGFLERYARRISMMHLKDLRRGLSGPDEVEPARDFLDLGEGAIDFRRIFMTLEVMGFEGPLVIEVDKPQPDRSPFDSARANYHFLVSLLREEQRGNHDL